MKRYILLIIVFIVGIAFAQDKPFAKKKKFSKKNEKVLNDITYEQTQDIEYTKKIKNKTKFKSYLTKDGLVISLGDTLILGTPNGGNRSQSVLQEGDSYSTFSTVMMGTMGGSLFTGPIFVGTIHQGAELVIEDIYVYHSGMNKNTVLNIFIFAKDYKMGTGKSKMISGRTILGIEQAINLGEVKLFNAPMSRQEAIGKLKEAKELLDLEIITQEEYDILKEELTPIIRKE